MNHIKLSVALCCMSSMLFAQNEDSETQQNIKLNPEVSTRMLNQTDDLRKVAVLLELQKEEKIKSNELVFGASLIALADYQKSTDDTKFGWLMRHPTAKNQIGKEVSEATLHSFQISTTYRIFFKKNDHGDKK